MGRWFRNCFGKRGMKIDYLGKKGDLWKFVMILVVIGVLFGVFIAYFAFAESAEEEKSRLEAELAGLEGQLSAIDGGKWVNISTENDPCKVSFVKYINWNCDGNIGYHTVCVSNSCDSMPDKVVKIKSRILEIEEELGNLGVDR